MKFGHRFTVYNALGMKETQLHSIGLRFIINAGYSLVYNFRVFILFVFPIGICFDLFVCYKLETSFPLPELSFTKYEKMLSLLTELAKPEIEVSNACFQTVIIANTLGCSLPTPVTDAQVTLSEKVRLSYLKSDEMGDPREFP